MRRPIQILILTPFFLSASIGCGKHPGFRTDEIPTEVARVEDLGNTSDEEDIDPIETKPSPEQASESDMEPERESENGSNETDREPLGPESEPPVTPPVPQKNNLWKTVVDVAKWVIKNEGRRVGKACNFYIQRVFELMGFGKASWMANDFDQYAKNHFESYKLKSFDLSSHEENMKNLRKYIWSYPERTGFVFQWKRSSRHGHIAFVQRIQNELIIYHASLRQFQPKSQLVTLDTLLHKGGRRNKLNVFSHFQKADHKK